MASYGAGRATFVGSWRLINTCRCALEGPSARAAEGADVAGDLWFACRKFSSALFSYLI